MTSDKHQNMEIAPKDHPNIQDIWLARIEACMIISISACILFFGLLTILWILSDCPWLSGVVQRLSKVLTALSNHWQLGIILVLILTYRPLRIILERAESMVNKAFSPSPTQAQPSAKPEGIKNEPKQNGEE